MECGGQRGTVGEQTRHVAGVVLRLAIFPAAIEAANPFASQGTNGGVLVVYPADAGVDRTHRPSVARNEMFDELLEGLAQEGRGRSAPVRPRAWAALFGHRCDAAQLLKLFGGGGFVAVGSEGDEQARTEYGAAPRR